MCFYIELRIDKLELKQNGTSKEISLCLGDTLLVMEGKDNQVITHGIDKNLKKISFQFTDNILIENKLS